MDLIKARTKRYKRRQAAFIMLAGLCTSRGPFAFCFAALPAERQMSLEARRQLGTLVLVGVHRYVQRAFGGQRCCFHRWQRGLPHRPRYLSGEKKRGAVRCQRTPKESSSSAAASAAELSVGSRVTAKVSRSSSHSRTFRSVQSCTTNPAAIVPFAAVGLNLWPLGTDGSTAHKKARLT
jgi:hypothetical protein